MLKFIRGLPAAETHRHLKAADRAMEEAKQNALLWFGEIVARRLFQDLGYGTVLAYAREELGWSRSKAYDFINITRKLEKLPAVKKEVEAGHLGYGRARQIVGVATSRNEEKWLDLARKSTHQDLQKEVKKARRRGAEVASGQMPLLDHEPGPVAPPPQRVTLPMNPTQLARYEALWEKLRKQGGLPGDQVEALLAVMQTCVDGNSHQLEKSTAPPVQIHVHQCPDCQKATVQTSRGELPLSPAEAERLACDALISVPGQRNTSSITPKTRREVLARDRHRCQGKGCNSTHYLEVHHIVPRARGGSNDPENLITLCSACHALVHRQGSVAGERAALYSHRGTSPPHNCINEMGRSVPVPRHSF
jgi:hypothetical protein|nr:HNH endonuclease [Candidatus Krumholzibacteria bacterium]